MNPPEDIADKRHQAASVLVYELEVLCQVPSPAIIPHTSIEYIGSPHYCADTHRATSFECDSRYISHADDRRGVIPLPVDVSVLIHTRRPCLIGRMATENELLKVVARSVRLADKVEAAIRGIKLGDNVTGEDDTTLI